MINFTFLIITMLNILRMSLQVMHVLPVIRIFFYKIKIFKKFYFYWQQWKVFFYQSVK